MQLKRTTLQTLKGSKFERKTKSLFKSKFGNKGHICVVLAVAVLFAKGPYGENGGHAFLVLHKFTRFVRSPQTYPLRIKKVCI